MDIIDKLNRIEFHDGSLLYLNLGFDNSKLSVRFQCDDINFDNTEHNEVEVIFEQVSEFTIWSPSGINTIKDMWKIGISSCDFWIENNVPKGKLDLISLDTPYYLVLAFSFEDASIEFSRNEDYAN